METNMTILDHVLIFVVTVVYPVSGYVSFQRLLRSVAAGKPVNRVRLYDLTLLGHWGLFAAAFAIWIYFGRTWSDLGFGLSIDAGFLAGAVLTVVGIVLLIMQLRQVANASSDDFRTFKSQIGILEVILPRNGNELGRFNVMAVTAGIVEETLWRGFLIWYLAHFMPLWGAAVLSAVGFGLAHAYQGIGNLPKITAVGAVFVVLFLVSGSLWLPMVLHAAVDLLQGRTAYEVIYRADIGQPPDGNGDTADACG
jgi:membrane protease YdiL (CAAX protease family)